MPCWPAACVHLSLIVRASILNATCLPHPPSCNHLTFSYTHVTHIATSSECSRRGLCPLQVCKLLKLPASSKGELLHMADLLAQMALLDTIKAPAATGLCSSASKGSKGSAASAGALRGFKASGSKLGGLGGSRGLLGGAGGRGGSGLGGSPMGSAGGAGQQGEVRLCLRASSSEVFAAVKHNPALRCLVDV